MTDDEAEQTGQALELMKQALAALERDIANPRVLDVVAEGTRDEIASLKYMLDDPFWRGVFVP